MESNRVGTFSESLSEEAGRQGAGKSLGDSRTWSKGLDDRREAEAGARPCRALGAAGRNPFILNSRKLLTSVQLGKDICLKGHSCLLCNKQLRKEPKERQGHWLEDTEEDGGRAVGGSEIRFGDRIDRIQ